jgi:hypothetical protein
LIRRPRPGKDVEFRNKVHISMTQRKINHLTMCISNLNKIENLFLPTLNLI